MAYNKTKHVETAQKFLHQGKTAQAIDEYQQVLKHEPRDQITLMTIGDLFVRQGDTFRALEYFERLAQIYFADGFVTKAIAIYKKIAKLAPEQTRPVEKLAELYVQQGVLSEARPIYLHLAEMQQRANRPEQAAALLRKLLEAEPDNLRVQTRLAELSLAAGQKTEAAAAFCAAARQLLARGDHAEAIKYVDRALKIDAGDAPATALKARVHVAGGQTKEAVALLEADSHLEEGGEAADLLLDLYLEAPDNRAAAALASRIFARDSKHFAPAQRVASTLLEAGESDRALTLVDLIRGAMTDAGEHELLSESLTRVVEQLPGRIEPREWLVELYGRTSDSFRLPDALASLGEALEAAGQHDRALQVFEQILERDPENEGARRRCNRVRAGLGMADAAADPVLETPRLVAPLEPHAAPEPAELPLDDETQRFISQALTDVDLFSSYGLTQKAIDLLETVLQRAPQNAVALERLLDLYLGAGDDRRTAELAAQLERIHKERGNTAAADRFSELHRRFERAADVAAEPPSAAPAAPPKEFSIPVVEAEPLSAAEAQSDWDAAPGGAASDTASSSTHEVDLSEEWAILASQIDGTLESPRADAAAGPSPAPADLDLDASAEPAREPVGAQHDTQADSAADYVLELERADGEPASTNCNSGALAAEINAALASLGGDRTFTDRSHAAPDEANSGTLAGPPPPANQAGPLSDVFEEFRADMGEAAADNEDLETHYNLGIAYREMGLLEEAISEFQKVAKAGAKGRAFRYAMQCCTLLGLAFIERGQPAIAAMWYERALETPGLDQETILALRYDLGVAQELAGDALAARKSFTQVYGMNIDYRDVAERLAALGKER